MCIGLLYSVFLISCNSESKETESKESMKYRCAVLEFEAVRSVSSTDVEGISEMFMTYFRPNGYTMVERAQIDKVLSEQNIQKSKITQKNMIRLGEILNVSKIVIGKISKLGGEYQVDVRVVDVESGHDIAFEGASFNGSYRNNVRKLATKLASQIEINSVYKEPVIPKGYVDLGLPSETLWKERNEKGFYLYSQAISQFGENLPTKEQFEELRDYCQWIWEEDGYTFKGPNGNSIFLPAKGYRECDGNVVHLMGWHNELVKFGYYWSSTPGGLDCAKYLLFVPGSVNIRTHYRCCGCSVRLVKNP